MVAMVPTVLLCCSIINLISALQYEESKTLNQEEERRCVVIDKCPSLYSLFSSQALTPLVIEFLKRSKCEFDESTQRLCCVEPETQDSDTPADDEQFRDSFDLMTHSKASLIPLESCGLDRDRIWEESVTELDEFPWLALLFVEYGDYDYYGNYHFYGNFSIYEDAVDRGGWDYNCAGVLISKRYVLTVADCVAPDRKLIMVRLGDHNLLSNPDCVIEIFSGRLQCAPPIQDFGIENVILHPEYDSSDRCNDIVLVRLHRDVKLDTIYVKPICLPVDDVEIGQKLLLSGWGETTGTFSSIEMNFIKMKTEMPVVSMEKCRKEVEEGWCNSRYMLCILRTNGKGPGSSDSGMPLMQWTNSIYGRRHYSVAGLVRHGFNGHEKQFTICTKVLQYVPWIVENIQP